jgi:hypothetical protein
MEHFQARRALALWVSPRSLFERSGDEKKQDRTFVLPLFTPERLKETGSYFELSRPQFPQWSYNGRMTNGWWTWSNLQQNWSSALNAWNANRLTSNAPTEGWDRLRARCSSWLVRWSWWGRPEGNPKAWTPEQFVLLGPDGKVRGAMGITPDGAVGLNLDDVKGQTRITLDVAPNGSPGLDFYDPQGKLRATFALGPTGTPGLGLYDANGKLRTSLDVPAANTPGLAFYHESGKPAWGAP